MVLGVCDSTKLPCQEYSEVLSASPLGEGEEVKPLRGTKR